jgi:hypothetical protein
VGYAEGPEHGLATALAADSNYLYYPAAQSGNIEILPIGQMCDPDAAANEMCPYRIAESQGGLTYDTITAKGGFVYWGNDSTVHKGNVALAVTGQNGGDDFQGAVFQTSLTAFALGTQYAYFAEPGADAVCSQDHATACVMVLMDGSTETTPVCPEATPANQTCVTLGYIEKGFAPPFDGGASGVVVARNQPAAMSLTLDGTNVYWTTSNCDIDYIADSPQ